MLSAAVAASNAAEALLRVRDLTVEIQPRSRAADRSAGWLQVVSSVSFDIPPGSIVGLFCESGCGKTTLALALPRLLPGRKYRVRGSVALGNRDLQALGERAMESVRGAQIAVLFQDPLLAMNPVFRARRIVSESLRAHGAEGPGRVEEAIELAGLEPSRRILDSYSHELSGGERQRVLLAAALACRPRLVIADEPFTALDAPRVLELAQLFTKLKERFGTAFLLIDHSPAVLSQIADHTLVMYAGRIVERGETRRLLANPRHPYTAALLASSPGADAPRKKWPAAIPGNPPGLGACGRGCPFEPRCAVRLDRCASEMPGEYAAGERQSAMCFQYGG